MTFEDSTGKMIKTGDKVAFGVLYNYDELVIETGIVSEVGESGVLIKDRWPGRIPLDNIIVLNESLDI